jgi:hypothetical protein
VGNSTIAGIPQPPGGIVASVLPWNIPKTVICLQLSAFCKSPVITMYTSTRYRGTTQPKTEQRIDDKKGVLL